MLSCHFVFVSSRLMYKGEARWRSDYKLYY